MDGFDTGIAVANTEYGVTLDHVRLSGQRRIGLENSGNAVSAADLTIEAAGTAIANTAPGGLVTLTHSVLRRGGEDGSAFLNRGAITALGVSLDGFAPPAGATTPLTGVLRGERWQNTVPGVRSRHCRALRRLGTRCGAWRNVLPGVKPNDQPRDITTALRDAMASGAATIYLPYGRYTISDAIDIPPTVRRIVGMNASLTVRPERNPDFARTSGMLRIDRSGPPLTIERLAFDMTDLGDQLAVEVTAARDVTLRDIVTAGTSLLDRGAKGGRVFIEDVCCGALRIAGPNPVIARQLDTEGGDTRILNDGSPLTILGLKTEGDGIVLDNRDGARSLILGGLLYVVRDADARVPAFRNTDASLFAAFLEESFRAASRYTVYLQDPRTGQQTAAAAFPDAWLRAHRAVASRRPLRAHLAIRIGAPGSPGVRGPGCRRHAGAAPRRRRCRGRCRCTTSRDRR